MSIQFAVGSSVDADNVTAKLQVTCNFNIILKGIFSIQIAIAKTEEDLFFAEAGAQLRYSDIVLQEYTTSLTSGYLEARVNQLLHTDEIYQGLQASVVNLVREIKEQQAILHYLTEAFDFDECPLFERMPSQVRNFLANLA